MKGFDTCMSLNAEEILLKPEILCKCYKERGSHLRNDEIAVFVKQLKEGDQSAFSEIYSRMWDVVYYLALRQLNNNHNDAADITQEVMMIVLRDIAQLREPLAFNSWIYRITVNCCKRYIGKNAKESSFLDELDNSLEEDRKEFLPQVVLESKELQNEVVEALQHLPFEQRQVILLYYYSELPTAEIANILNTSQNSVFIRLSRARKAIRAQLESGNIRLGSLVITPVPIFTIILQENSRQVCTNSIKESILLGLKQQMIVSTAAVPVGASISLKAIVGLILVVGLGVSGYIYGNSFKDPDNRIVEVNEIPQEKVTASEPQVANTLQDFVGEVDALSIIAWFEPVMGAKRDAFEEILTKHSISYGSSTIGSQDRSSYLLYYIEKLGKRLLLVEVYNADSKKWRVVYTIEDAAVSIPSSDEIINLFTQISSKK